MCRYGMYGPYKQHYACFDCRKMFRKPGYFSDNLEYCCPNCRHPMQNMGLDFKAPKRNNREQWAVVKVLAAHNIRFHSCGCSGPGYRPTCKRELVSFLQKSLPKSPGALFLQSIPRRKLRQLK